MTQDAIFTPFLATVQHLSTLAQLINLAQMS